MLLREEHQIVPCNKCSRRGVDCPTARECETYRQFDRARAVYSQEQAKGDVIYTSKRAFPHNVHSVRQARGNAWRTSYAR